MKIKKIKISWFRGAADPVELDLNLKSLILYGENGTGKSSFVDAVEHNINNGRINHLAHEYSGKRQEKAIVNTHTPKDKNGEIAVTLEDDSTIETEIKSNGNFTVTPTTSDIQSWDYRRTILRQNEVADFIANTKGDKYSALLPLLGLSHLEVIAENLRKIEKSLPIIGALDTKRLEINKAETKTKLVFRNATKEKIKNDLKNLYKTYCKKTATTETLTALIASTLTALQIKITHQSVEQKRYSSFLEISKLDINTNLADIKASAIKLGESANPLIAEKLSVLRAAAFYSEKNREDEIACPACGKQISSLLFSSHIKAEEVILKEAVVNFNLHKTDISNLCENLQNLKRVLTQDQIKDWKDKQNSVAVSFIESIEVDSVRGSCTSEIQTEIEKKIIPIIEEAKKEVVNPLQDVAELVNDKEKLETLQLMIKASELKKKVRSAEELIAFISTLQRLYREQIRAQSSTVIGTISTDIARMWGILHPNEKIEDVRLCLPDDIDKAIEVSLKFYGVDQDSPRLTLSEGHRNSLGLCIFLAMAKKDVNNPVILDDVVVSFDRNHRGMVGFLLEKEFSDRQVILFTHERDWYIDLRAQLDKKIWIFKTLIPWESPKIGIRFSTKQYTFDDARKFLPTDPDLAGNTARKIMDVYIPGLAESLKISLPYLHREKNDHRMVHEFLEKIASLSTSFQIKRDGTNYEQFTEALDDIKAADRLIVSWANRSSHEFNIVEKEASVLIEVCEKAVSRFTCEKCKKDVINLINEKSSFKQCECGYIKWKY